MVISHAFCIESIQSFWHFQTDHGRKVNCSYSWITYTISLAFFPFFCGSSLYFLIVRRWYIWLNGLLLSDVSDIDFVLHMWNRVTLQEFWNQVIYQLFKHTCALLMKLPIFTCLKLFASNTLFTSCLRILNISTFFCFWFEIY